MVTTSAAAASTMDLVPTLPQHINYSAFPPEIRNKIIELVLIPRDIHPPYTRTGVQLLGTNHQNYDEGYLMYYSDSIFHISHGRHYLELLKKYQPKHLKLIRRVTLTCGILDLDEDTIDIPFDSALCLKKCPHMNEAPSYNPVYCLEQIWREKIVAI